MKPNETTFHLGIDFDHTIVDYGNIFAERASNLGYLESSVERTKDEVKKLLKESDEGDKKWGILQAEVYSEGIGSAKIMEGFESFVEECRRLSLSLAIVSHKSKNNPFDPQNRNLQQPALDWMRTNRFFDESGFGFDLGHIYLVETLEDKIEKINTLNCSHFIDDLLSVLLHPLFPKSTRNIHFSTEAINYNSLPVDYTGNWRNIQDYLIRDRKHHDA